MIAKQSGVSRVRGSEKQTLWMLHLESIEETSIKTKRYLTNNIVSGSNFESYSFHILAGELGEDVGEPGGDHLDGEHRQRRLQDCVVRARADQETTSWRCRAGWRGIITIG